MKLYSLLKDDNDWDKAFLCSSGLALNLKSLFLNLPSNGTLQSWPGDGGAYLLILALDRGKWIIIIILSGLSPNFSSFLFAYRC